MENILPVIPAWIMLTIGVVLLALELLSGAFVILFFGMAFLVVGYSGFMIDWQAGEYQVLAVAVLGGILTYVLRGYFMRGMSKEDLPLETMQVGESGIIVDDGGEQRLRYKGTTWAFKYTGEDAVAIGDEVMVVELKNNVALVTK
ncbi:NfeD family protein [Thiomicrorhabdus lithotrophica]|uniref:NfeD family protein n=1 Tax=Thiomicrorhabdus lithotrophica TaxID=2949997 RepID=A0ABY8CA38_9GAMM|nr:NfeD family protein [Thiomicrorhabdus lithotrophica]WEJ62845.1 NfeD family protein [Thiomicrorhabdus lithotrophica]